MKINKLKLQNYRSHSSFEANFTKGINLLLGKNGAGKSSVLEAIGLCLFGAKPRTTLNETIKFGEKFALIDIEFVGNDGNTYRVEKKIGQSAFVKLFVANEQTPRLNGDDAQKFIKELVGMGENSDVIYKNIITAEQNKLTEIFQLSDTKRADEFNRIFNTEIYREIYQKNSLTILKEYQTKLELKIQEISIHSGNLKDTAELKTNLSNEQINLSNLKNEAYLVKYYLEDYEKRRKDNETELKQINKLKNEISKNQSRLNELERLIAKLNEDLNSARHSSEIVKENLQFYEQYQEIEKNIKSLANAINILEKTDENKRKIEKEIAKNEKDLHTLKSKIESNNEIYKLKSDEITLINSKISSFENESQSTLSQLNEVEYKLNIINKTKNDFAQLMKSRQQKSNEIDSISKLLTTKHSHLIDEKAMIDEINNIQDNLSEFEIKKNDKIRFETQKEQLNVRNKILSEAKAKLKGSICPYFEQKCKNMDETNDSDLYFNSILDDIKIELNDINTKLKELKDIDKNIDSAKNQINLINNKLMNNKDLLLEIEKYKGNMNVLNEELSTNIKQIEIVFQNHTIPFEYDLEQLDQSNKMLNTQFDEFNKLFAEKSTIKRNCDNNIIENRNKLNLLKAEIAKIEADNFANSNKIIQIEALINENKTVLNKLDYELVELPNFKSKMDQFRHEQETVKPKFMLYTKHLDNSSKVDLIFAEIEKEQKLILEIKNQIVNLSDDLAKINEQKILENTNKIAENIKSANEKRAEIASKIATVSSLIDSLTIAINHNIELEAKIVSLKKEEDLLNKKIMLTQKFRDNINSMGTIVAGRLLAEIARTASDNYFRISQKAESIEWVNNQSDKYQIYLINNATQSKRSFEMLSGGEQVSVAIAIRTALAQSLTSAKFAIFDEPTVNLDKERKELLSQSLNTMLENLEQVLVVTHDDTFKEMAEAIEIN